MTDLVLQGLVDEFERASRKVLSDAELRSILEDAGRELGFAFVGLVRHVSFRRTQPELAHLDNYPDSWRDEFVDRKLYLHDPILLASQRTTKGFCWSDVGRHIPVSAKQRHVLERSMRFGMGPGFTVPANLHGEPSASCSFAVRSGRPMPTQWLRAAELIGIDALHAARRLRGYVAGGSVPHLSRRQQQCLRLAAAGKSDWEIANILGISFETARRYMKSARAAYDVVSRTQLVVHGLRDGYVHFDDAIAPSG